MTRREIPIYTTRLWTRGQLRVDQLAAIEIRDKVRARSKGPRMILRSLKRASACSLAFMRSLCVLIVENIRIKGTRTSNVFVITNVLTARIMKTADHVGESCMRACVHSERKSDRRPRYCLSLFLFFSPPLPPFSFFLYRRA